MELNFCQEKMGCNEIVLRGKTRRGILQKANRVRLSNVIEIPLIINPLFENVA